MRIFLEGFGSCREPEGRHEVIEYDKSDLYSTFRLAKYHLERGAVSLSVDYEDGSFKYTKES